jgi:hypothetical protein
MGNRDAQLVRAAIVRAGENLLCLFMIFEGRRRYLPRPDRGTTLYHRSSTLVARLTCNGGQVDVEAQIFLLLGTGAQHMCRTRRRFERHMTLAKVALDMSWIAHVGGCRSSR